MGGIGCEVPVSILVKLTHWSCFSNNSEKRIPGKAFLGPFSLLFPSPITTLSTA